MVSSEELKVVFSGISDEELVRRINSDDLTPLARDIAQEELDLRKINLSQFQLRGDETSTFSEVKFIIKPIINKSLKFPLKAFSGSEPLWVVLVFGIVTAFIVNQILVQFSTQYIITTRVSSLSFPILYFLLGCRLVIYAFISIAIWRSAFNTNFKIFPIVAFACSCLFILFVFWSTYITLEIVKEFNPRNSSNIMENSVIKMQ